MNGIALKDVDLGYDRQTVIRGATLDLPAGSATAIIGPNGAGKSTLLKTICGLLKPLRGRVECEGGIAYLPQRAEIERGFPVGVRDLVMLGGWGRMGAFGGAPRALAEAAEAAIERVGLSGFSSEFVGRLSIGQFQRALFARLIVQDAPIILLDEPFAAIDLATTGHLLALIDEWRAEGRTLAAALHDMDQVRGHFPEAVLIDRAILDSGPAEAVLARMRHGLFHAAADCGGGIH